MCYSFAVINLLLGFTNIRLICLCVRRARYCCVSFVTLEDIVQSLNMLVVAHRAMSCRYTPGQIYTD